MPAPRHWALAIPRRLRSRRVALGTPSRSRWWLGPVWGIMENVTTAEHMAGRLDAAKLERLSAEFEAVGYVFLDNVVPDHEVPTNSGCG